MIRKLLRTVPLENGELYGIVGSRRILLANCQPKVEVYEHSTRVTSIGRHSYDVKSNHAVLVLCPDPETTREVNAEFLQTVSQFDLRAEIQREDGVFEVIMFENLYPNEIELGGDWEFELTDPEKIARKFLTI